MITIQYGLACSLQYQFYYKLVNKLQLAIVIKILLQINIQICMLLQYQGSTFHNVLCRFVKKISDLKFFTWNI